MSVKTKKKNVFVAIVLMVATVAMSVFACSIVARNTSAFKESNLPFGVNSENLVHTLDEYETVAGNTGKGITWKVNSTGSIVADGTYSINQTSNLEFVLGTVTIEDEDIYTLSGASGGSTETYYIEARYTDGNGNVKVLYSDFNGSMTSANKIPVGTQVTLKIVVNPGVEFNNFTFKPTLVRGSESGRF